MAQKYPTFFSIVLVMALLLIFPALLLGSTVYADGDTPEGGETIDNPQTETGGTIEDGETPENEDPPAETSGESEQATFTITYKGLPSIFNAPTKTTYQVGTTVDFSSESLKPTYVENAEYYYYGGYVFLEWCADDACTIPAPNITEETTGDVTVWAKVRLNKITVKFVGWDYEDVEVEYGSVASAILSDKNPTKNGYEFIGWFLSTQYTEKIGDNYVFTGYDGSEIKFYAKFEKRAEPWVYYSIYAFAGLTVVSYLIWWIAFKPKKERIDV